MSLSTSDFDPSALTKHARWVLAEIERPIVQFDTTPEELAEQHGVSRRQIGRWRDDLRAELRAQSRWPSIPPLSDDEREALKAEIAEHGVLVPVEYDVDNDRLIDGHNREAIAKELGIECPRHERRGLSVEESYVLSLVFNLARRHLSQTQRRELAEAQLVRDPSRSDREIARLVGVSDKTVGSTRRELEGRAEIPHVAFREDVQGRRQPAKRRIALKRKFTISIQDVSEEERERWLAAAQAQGLKVSDWLRQLANREVA